jgi:DNA/RNA-binding domain of Phe-tRNA-synthetase-like protein
MHVTIEDHPLLEAALFVTVFPRPLGELSVLPALGAAPLASSDEVRKHVRDLLRQGGYKPTGRGKPSSEYLLGVAAEGPLPAINLAVDACNAVSLHSGLPISVVDLERAREPLSIRVAPQGSSYVFNASGQTIDLDGLLCLCDADGPCANAVKDAQRTKTSVGTTRTLSVVWGTRALAGRAAQAAQWYRRLLEQAGARTEDVD